MERVQKRTRALLIAAFCSVSLLGVHAVVADAPAGHFSVTDGVVLDTQTMLTWQRAVTDERLGVADAAAYCAELDLAGSGWRLPTIKELHTLVDETRTQPAIDAALFPSTRSSFFWTSSRVASFQQYLWAVNFAEGTDAWFTEETPRYVRCVR